MRSWLMVLVMFFGGLQNSTASAGFSTMSIDTHNIGEATVTGSLAVSGSSEGDEKRTILETGEIIPLAAGFLYAKLMEQEKGARITVIPLSRSNVVHLHAGIVTTSYRVISLKPARRRTCVWADIRINNKHYRSIPLWYRVEIYRNAAVAVRDFPMKSSFSEDSFEIKEVDVAGSDDAFYALPLDIQGYRAKRAIKEGQVLLRSSIERIPDVLSGARVQVHVNTGAVSLQTYGIAQSSGNIGEIVTVMNVMSNRIFKATVSGNASVMVSQR